MLRSYLIDYSVKGGFAIDHLNFSPAGNGMKSTGVHHGFRGIKGNYVKIGRFKFLARGNIEERRCCFLLQAVVTLKLKGKPN